MVQSFMQGAWSALPCVAKRYVRRSLARQAQMVIAAYIALSVLLAATENQFR